MTGQIRNARRVKAAEQFADVCSFARREGFALIAHSNSGYELQREDRSVGWFFPDHSDSTLNAFVRALIAKETEAVK